MSLPLNLGLFAADNLQTEDGFAHAFSRLNVILSAETRIDDVISDLLRIPNLLPFVCSESQYIHNGILDAFPTDPVELLSSCFRDILDEFSSLFFSFSSDTFLGVNSPRNVGLYRRYVEDVWPALSALSSTNFDVMTPRQRSYRTIAAALDTTQIHRLGINVPSTASEAVQAATEVMTTLKEILHFYLELSLEPRPAEAIKEVYLSGNTSLDDIDEVFDGFSRMAPECPLAAPSIYPQVQPLRAAFYIGEVQGFGKWRIVVSNNATKHLRELRRRDLAKTKHVLRKLRELSRGEFSHNNQKRLKGSSQGIPIYEAVVESDLRLVYQIDCVPDVSKTSETQIIKIYGVFNHKQLHHIWTTLSNHLAQRGKEYQRRCTFRTRISPGAYLPASFPPNNEDPVPEPPPLVFSDEELDEGFSRLFLDKYVEFSKAYLNRLIVDQDIELPFEPTVEEWRIVQCPTSSFVLGRSGTGKTTAILFKMLGIQKAWENTPGSRKPRQMFVTRSRVLRAKVEECFNNLLESLALAGCTQEDLKKIKAKNTDKEVIMTDPMNIQDCCPGVPRKYSDLTDHDFPLFITFDQLANMIAADLWDEGFRGKLKMSFDEKYSFITYSLFKNMYWPRLTDKWRKTLAPWLVFSEFVGVIEGSEEALRCPRGYLDKQTYLELSTRTSWTFADQREWLYDMFLSYCKLRGEYRGYDMADRTHAILEPLLSGSPLKGQRVDYIYVDEAQDNLIIDAFLLRILCRNPEGMLWAGDTAQTISAGCSFRFSSLKSFLYRIEAEKMNGIEKQRMSTPAFELTDNYRSHSGIVNCAREITAVIYRLWPNTIDILRTERGMMGGPKPTFFCGWDDEHFPFKLFFTRSGQHVPHNLGAGQCILVRDDAARQRFIKEFGKIGLIMALHDSKGLEFDDVFLYNFFEDSEVERSQWCILLSTFSAEAGSRCKDLCADLKFLYVGITRAKNRLYFLDNSTKGDVMRMFWSAKGCIEEAPPTGSIFEFAIPSTKAEWGERGHELFLRGQFSAAIDCFEPRFPRELAIAKAFQLREDAEAIPHYQVVKRERAFISAAEAFVRCVNDASEREREWTDYHRIAAKCYAHGGDPRSAAKHYISANDLEKGVQQYESGGHYDHIVSLLESRRKDLSPVLQNRLIRVCRIHFYRHGLARPSVLDFFSLNDELEFLKEHGLHAMRIQLLECNGRYTEAAEVCLQQDQPLRAIQSLLKVQDSDDAFQRAGRVIVDSLRQHCSFDLPVEDIFGEETLAWQILSQAKQMSSRRLIDMTRYQISLFSAIQRKCSNEVHRLGDFFLNKGDEPLALLAFGMLLQSCPLQSVQPENFLDFQEIFESYAYLVASLISRDDPLVDQNVQWLFGITEASGDNLTMQPRTYLNLRSNIKHGTRMELDVQLKAKLRTRLSKEVQEETRIFHKYVSFTAPCIPFMVLGICYDAKCGGERISKASTTVARYGNRVKSCLRQIRIHHLTRVIELQERWDKSKGQLLAYLYTAVHPLVYLEGSVADIDISNCDPKQIQVIQEWLRESLDNLHARDDFWKYLMDVIRLTRLRLTFGGRPTRNPHDGPFGMIPNLRPGPYESYIVNAIIKAFDGTSSNSISHGVSALQYLIQRGVRMDIALACDLAEEVCSRITVSLCQLHRGVRLAFTPILPRRWLLDRTKFIGRSLVSFDYAFLWSMREMLNLLRSGKARNRFSLPSGTKSLDISIFRMCRMLCIMGYNIRHHLIDEEISDIVFPLPEGVDAEKSSLNVDDLRERFMNMIQPLDDDMSVRDLVQLVRQGEPDKGNPFPAIPRIPYKNWNDIPALVAQRRTWPTQAAK